MPTYDEMSRYIANQREKELRELLRRDYGKFRITSNSEVHAWGVEGWYSLGTRLYVETEIYRF